MATLADVATIEEIYYRGEWAERRREAENRYYWYSGEEWKKDITTERDEDGNYPKKWPLQVNPIAKACRIHRAVMIGVLDEVLISSPIKMVIGRKGLEEGQKDLAIEAEDLLNRVWYDSKAHSILFESTITAQYYGGSVFQVKWWPEDKRLRYRIGLQAYKDPSVLYPIAYDPVTYEILECYIGYEVSAAFAKAQYNIEPDEGKENVLYLEHWTKTTFEITVDRKAPKKKQQGMEEMYEFKGVNTWGIVPVVYIPHERDGDFWGRSLIDSDSPAVGLAKEWNARMTDKGDLVQESVPVFWTKNARNAQWDLQEIEAGGRVTLYVLDIGQGTPVGPGLDPEIGVVQSIGIPPGVAQYTSEVQSDFRSQLDLAAVAFGEDDVSGGRITGPVTAYRMWPTTMHTFSERSFWNDGLRELAHIIFVIALERMAAGRYAAFKAKPPAIDEGVFDFVVGTDWLPMIPIERAQRVEMVVNRLNAGAISILSALQELGVQDPEEEEARIWADKERLAEIETKPKLEVAEVQVEAQAAAFEARSKQRETAGGNGNG